MHEAFATIEVDQLATEYHRGAIDGAFRDSLSRFLEDNLLPQLDEPFESTEGTITPCFNEEKYCGPNSAVRDAYRLKFAFVRESGADEFEGEIYRNPKDGTFRMRFPHQPMVLWTASRKKDQEEFGKEIESIVKRILDGEEAEQTCPRCGTVLNVIDSPHVFDVTCPNRCFAYNFHRDPKTREFMHGHVFVEPRGIKQSTNA